MKTAFILQPGKLGDLIITTPIAKYYNSFGYNIKWIVFDNFKSFFDYFDFVTPITLNYNIDSYYSNIRKNLNSENEMKFTQSFYISAYREIQKLFNKEDILLDISWGFVGSPLRNNCLIQHYHNQGKNWIDMRYDLANVSLKERWNFSWLRNEEKENNLLNFIKDFAKKKYGTENYSICHNYANNKKNIKLKNQINFSYIEGYSIFDWYKVLLNADEIACVDSSLCNFVEVLPLLKDKKKYYLGSEEAHYFEYMRNILLNNWVDTDNKQIISDYADKI